jgi:hypothetical protein
VSEIEAAMRRAEMLKSLANFPSELVIIEPDKWQASLQSGLIAKKSKFYALRHVEEREHGGDPAAK